MDFSGIQIHQFDAIALMHLAQPICQTKLRNWDADSFEFIANSPENQFNTIH